MLRENQSEYNLKLKLYKIINIINNNYLNSTYNLQFFFYFN